VRINAFTMEKNSCTFAMLCRSYCTIFSPVALEGMLYEHDDKELPVVPPEKFDKAKHTDIKGIQGCHNSCYLDATLYGMFSFSDAFDAALLDVATPDGEEQHIQKMLKNKIIYPLRV